MKPGTLGRYLALAVLLAVTAVPIVDAMGFEDPRRTYGTLDSWWGFTPPYYPGDDYPAVTLTLPEVSNWNSHYLAITVAWAVRDAAGQPIEELLVPADILDLTDREPDPRFNDLPAEVTEGYLMWYTGDKVVHGDNVEHEWYSWVLSDEIIAGLEETGRLVEYPWDVWALQAEEPSASYTLFTDRGGDRIFALPTGYGQDL